MAVDAHAWCVMSPSMRHVTDMIVIQQVWMSLHT